MPRTKSHKHKDLDDIGNVEIRVSSEKRKLIVSEDVNDVSAKRRKVRESDRWNGDEDKCEIVDIIDDVVVDDKLKVVGDSKTKTKTSRGEKSKNRDGT
ncbi:hypothetical protein Tco_0054741 [Tanacetum coccineum]